MKVLVIGGTGFIGKAIAYEAVKRGFSVDVLGIKTLSNSEMNPDIEYLQADITNPNVHYTAETKKYDYVINAGGYINHSKFSQGGDKVLDQHLLGVMNLVKALDRSNLKKFVQIGSSDEYGNTLAPQSEESRESPISPYSLGKAASTHFLQMLNVTEGLPTTTIRLFLCYGPGQDRARFKFT